MLVLLGALSIAGVGIGAATLSEMPFGGPQNGGCGAYGSCPNGQAGGMMGGWGPANRGCALPYNGTCPHADDGACPYADDGTCPYADQTTESG